MPLPPFPLPPLPYINDGCRRFRRGFWVTGSRTEMCNNIDKWKRKPAMLSTSTIALTNKSVLRSLPGRRFHNFYQDKRLFWPVDITGRLFVFTSWCQACHRFYCSCDSSNCSNKHSFFLSPSFQVTDIIFPLLYNLCADYPGLFLLPFPLGSTVSLPFIIPVVLGMWWWGQQDTAHISAYKLVSSAVICFRHKAERVEFISKKWKSHADNLTGLLALVGPLFFY